MNKYEFTRSICFSLKGDINNLKVENSSNEEQLYKEFIRNYNDLILSFKKVVFNDIENQKVRTKLEVNYKWLRNYAREKYNELNNENIKNYTIQEAGFLKEVFAKVLSENKELYDYFCDRIEQEKNDKEKRADISFGIRQFLSHDCLFLLSEFVQYAKDKQTSQYLNELKNIVKDIKKLAEQIQQKVAPDQSKGLEVARASFNYYTINKISKNFDKNLETEEKKLNKTFSIGEFDLQLLREVGFEKFVQQEEFGNKLNDVSLLNLYDGLKDFKSQQKVKFLEEIKKREWIHDMQDLKKDEKQCTKNIEGKVLDLTEVEGKSFNGFEALGAAFGIEKKEVSKPSYVDEKKNAQLCFEWIKKNFPLFIPKNETVLKDFLKITEEIEQLGVDKNQEKQGNNYKEVQKNEKQIRDKRVKRGGYFQGNYVFKKYNDYCNEYKKVAMAWGKIRAKIRSLEQEKVEARLLKYWAHIVQEGNKRQVLLIPKEGDNLKNAKKYIENIEEQKTNLTLFGFNSLTLRALDKLIRRNIGKDIEKLNKDPISIYKKVLRGGYPEIKIDFCRFESEIKKVESREEYQDVEDFRMALESISYFVSKHGLLSENIEYLKENFNAEIYDITSYDLERNISHKKEHTILWEDFWEESNKKNNYTVRINPELRMFYRKAQEDLSKEKRKNRFSREQLTIAFTLTQNAAKKRIETAFEEKDRLIAITKKFNEDVIKSFVKEKGAELYYYGIDRGNEELASLCITQFSKEKYEAMLLNGEKKKFDIPIFPEIKTFKIKDECLKNEKEIIIDKKGNKTKVTLIDNPSNFINENVFEEVNSPFMDLTTSKLIKGKIILNGDIKTFLALKKANAKRRLFDVFSKIDSTAQIEFCTEEHPAWNVKKEKGYFMRNSFVIRFKESERNDYQLLCYYTEREISIFSTEQMCAELQEYLDDLRGDRKMEKTSIDRINNLRDAITANMVGIIAYLFEKYPGIINLENMHTKEHIDNQFRQNNESIARRLEWSLYKKFQKFGLVPPQLRQTIFLRDKDDKEDTSEKLNQFGIIHFVPIADTSANCPYCGIKSDSKKRKELKWDGHHYLCTNGKCSFNTKDNKKVPLEKIDNSDAVASYNIAKSK